MQRQGLYCAPKKPPFTPGMECSGTVEELGENVTDLEVRSKQENPMAIIIIIIIITLFMCQN